MKQLANTNASYQPAPRTKRVQEQKVAQRKRTRDLYHSLDPLVPTFTRPALEEKGSLPSGRTFLQLAEDTVEHIRNMRAQRRIEEQTTCGCTGTGRGARWTQIAMGMLSSKQLFLIEVVIEVEKTQLTVSRISEGIRSLFRHLPRENTIIGECLSHYVDLPSAQLLRSVLQESNETGTGETKLQRFPEHETQRINRTTGPFGASQTESLAVWSSASTRQKGFQTPILKTLDITLLTFPHPGLVHERGFFVQRIVLQDSVTEMWLLSPHASRPALPGQDSKIEKMQIDFLVDQ